MQSKAESKQDSNLFQQLDGIVRTLRSPEGCPWDQQQTGTTLKKYLLEEASELVQAIETGEVEHIREEIGDMYFILTLLALIYEEKDGIPATDPVQKICEKMVRRHPHVFECVETRAGHVLSEQELRDQWERIKQEEKKSTGKK
ncbi:MAG: nucleotide pyrophosphohydrolase [Candidatus Electrothrix sp. AW5]|nr:nucleotide pyrophosphohydrolase [Candidatus Electrothrix sp. AX1]MCI5183681.1 nucleotide pyrophosphohydrolase [Candidatus Electrothrix gigas]MCI5194765.1 nucleotide pyrophosphohydrolase [Candidatus Electrothrix gigas]